MRKNWIIIIGAILTLSLFQVVGPIGVFANDDTEVVIVADTENADVVEEEQVVEDEGVESEEANQPYGDEEVPLEEGDGEEVKDSE